MLVKFIAHAGFSLEEAGHQLLLDPWFTDSTPSNPVVHAVVGHDTLDFQVPKTAEALSSYHPDTILVSHFHAHHAPYDDLVTFATTSPELLIGFPDIGEATSRVRDAFSLWPSVETRPVQHDGVLRRGPFGIRGLSHAAPDHMAWFVRSHTGSVLHIADPIINRDGMDRRIGKEWEVFRHLQPDVLCINAGGNSLAREKDGTRYIIENVAVAPVEAARLAELIRPRAVCLIGCYNWSIWRNRSEYMRPAPIIEEELRWALSWLLPDTRLLSLQPGSTIGIGEQSLAGEVDHYLEAQLS